MVLPRDSTAAAADAARGGARAGRLVALFAASSLLGCPPGPPPYPKHTPAQPPAAPVVLPMRQVAPAVLDDGPVYAAAGAEAGWPRRAIALPDGPGRAAVEGHCATCHGLTYVLAQPPLEAGGWTAVVTKMQKVHGAVLPAGVQDEVVAYLRDHFGPGSIAATWSALYPAPAPPPLAPGAQVFAASCSPCHQQDGRGLPGAFPPLAGRAGKLAAADRGYPLRVVLFGLQGPLTIGAATYDNAMPGWPQLTDDDLAAVLNHVTSLGGGTAPGYTAEEVAAARAQALTPQEVHASRPKAE